MNTATATQTVTIADRTFTHTEMMGKFPLFRTANGAEFYGQPTHQNANEFYMVPTARRAKVAGRFIWAA